MFYNVYQIEIRTPSSPHHIIFVESSNDGGGVKFHVKRVGGRDDMIFKREYVAAPGFGTLSTFKSRDYIGRIKPEEKELNRMEAVCRDITPPSTQYDTAGTCNCYNWVSKAVTALQEDGVLNA